MGSYSLLILATLVGFFALAYVLLAPVYRFLEREQQASKEWTPERIAERLKERRASSNGANESEGSEQEGSPDAG
jgi:hypothetical protein